MWCTCCRHIVHPVSGRSHVYDSYGSAGYFNKTVNHPASGPANWRGSGL